ncbi:MAG TPA: protein phosphatase 2C domain-containing protein [Gemmatimonadales bacterium]|jgi:protein phosphatase|nr:protein phosphatase 2C domain-containing protein [Gemmatimonadales bacterium]
MSAAVHVSVFAKTDLGQTREHNEDSFLVADLSTGTASLMPDVREHDVGKRGSLFVVADGMGGAAAGELASSMATEVIWQHLITTWATDTELTAELFALRLREAVERANAELFQYAEEHPEVHGMGTTLTMAGVFGAELYLAQIGDSRAYLIRNGRTSQLTRDQSLTQRLIDAGELSEEEAERSERRNIILQALGPDLQIRVDLSHQALRRGDLLVMCSDGLSGLVKRDEIGEAAERISALPELCSALIDLANSRGGPDNITVVAARFGGEGLELPDTGDEVGYHNLDIEEVTTIEFPSPIPAVAPEKRTGSPRTLVIGAIIVTVLIALALVLLF